MTADCDFSIAAESEIKGKRTAERIVSAIGSGKKHLCTLLVEAGELVPILRRLQKDGRYRDEDKWLFDELIGYYIRCDKRDGAALIKFTLIGRPK